MAATKQAGKPPPTDGCTPEQHLREALDELGKARDRAGDDIREGIDAAIERTREA